MSLPEVLPSVDALALERVIRSMQAELANCYDLIRELHPWYRLSLGEFVENSQDDYAQDRYREFVREAEKRGAM